MQGPRRTHGAEIRERIAARRRRDRTTRTFHDGQESRDIPVAKFRIHHDVGAARSHGKVPETISHRPVEFDAVDERLNPGTAVLLPRRPMTGCQERRFFKISAVPHLKRPINDGTTVFQMHDSSVKASDGSHICCRMAHGGEDRSKSGTVIALQGDERSEQKRVRNKAAGSVDRIQYPTVANALYVSSLSFAPLFTEDAVIGEFSFDHPPHFFFSEFVGFGDGTAVRLIFRYEPR